MSAVTYHKQVEAPIYSSGQNLTHSEAVINQKTSKSWVKWTEEEKNKLRVWCEANNTPSGIPTERWRDAAVLVKHEPAACQRQASRYRFLKECPSVRWTEKQKNDLKAWYKANNTPSGIPTEKWRDVASLVEHTEKACYSQVFHLGCAGKLIWTKQEFACLKSFCKQQKEGPYGIALQKWERIAEKVHHSVEECQKKASQTSCFPDSEWSKEQLTDLKSFYEDHSSKSKEDWEWIARRVNHTVRACKTKIRDLHLQPSAEQKESNLQELFREAHYGSVLDDVWGLSEA